MSYHKYSQNEYEFERRGERSKGNRNYQLSRDGYEQGYRERVPNWKNTEGTDRSDSYYSSGSTKEYFRPKESLKRYEEYSVNKYNSDSYYGSRSVNVSYHPDQRERRPEGYLGSQIHQSTYYQSRKEDSYHSRQRNDPPVSVETRESKPSFERRFSSSSSYLSNDNSMHPYSQGLSRRSSYSEVDDQTHYYDSDTDLDSHKLYTSQHSNIQRCSGNNNDYSNYFRSSRANEPEVNTYDDSQVYYSRRNSQDVSLSQSYRSKSYEMNFRQYPDDISNRPEATSRIGNSPDFGPTELQDPSLPPPKMKKYRSVRKRRQRSSKKSFNIQRFKKMKSKVNELSMSYAQKGPQGEKPNEKIKGGEGNFLEDCITQSIGDVQYNTDERFLEIEAPLYTIPYPEQVKIKHECGKKLVSKICDDMSHLSYNVNKFMDRYKEKNNGFPCKIHDIAYAGDKCNDFRSKIDLVVGPDEETKKPCIGIRLKNSQIIHFKEDMPLFPKMIFQHIRAFEKFLTQSQIEVSPLPDDEKDYVTWGRLGFRIGFQTNQLMMIPACFATNLNDERIDLAKKELINYYSGKQGQGITSLYIEVIKRRKQEGPAYSFSHLLGELYIEGVVNDITFRLDPNPVLANCQMGAELINDTVRFLGRLNRNVILIDVGSPHAMVSLCLAKDVKKAYFIEGKQTPLEYNDGLKALERHCAHFKLSNWEKYEGKFNQPFREVYNQLAETSDCIVYFDVGCDLNFKAVEVLKASKRVNRLMFLTSGRKQAMTTFRSLAMENNNYNYEDVFVPVEACSIDKYPHRKKMLVLVLFERMIIANRRLK